MAETSLLLNYIVSNINNSQCQTKNFLVLMSISDCNFSIFSLISPGATLYFEEGMFSGDLIIEAFKVRVEYNNPNTAKCQINSLKYM